jgi:hypothetical protein
MLIAHIVVCVYASLRCLKRFGQTVKVVVFEFVLGNWALHQNLYIDIKYKY